MSQPRAIVPGATYLITRRVLRRHLLLRPDAAINQLLVYSLAVSAFRFGVQVHAVCAMSTHLHLVVTDTAGVLPRFLHFFHRIVALGTKVLRAWEGPVWDHDQTSVVRLWTRAAVVEKIAYTMSNPVVAGLVRRASEWPGVKASVAGVGHGALHARRPTIYFDPTNPGWPAEATLPLTLPPVVEPGNEAAFGRELLDELDRLEESARSEVQRRGQRFLGAERVCRVSPSHRATSYEALRERNPTFAVGRDQGGAWHRAAALVREFRAAYRHALEGWRTHVHQALFPAGTWWMRVFHGAPVSEVIPYV